MMEEIQTAKKHLEKMIRNYAVDIVILDDDPKSMEQTRKLLSESGFHNVTCISPDNVNVERLEMIHPKLIVSDLFGCRIVDQMLNHFGKKMIINTGFHDQHISNNLKKEVFAVSCKDDPAGLLDCIKNFFSLEAA